MDKCWVSAQFNNNETFVYTPVSMLLSKIIVLIVVQYISLAFNWLLLISKNEICD